MDLVGKVGMVSTSRMRTWFVHISVASTCVATVAILRDSRGTLRRRAGVFDCAGSLSHAGIMCPSALGGTAAKVNHGRAVIGSIA